MHDTHLSDKSTQRSAAVAGAVLATATVLEILAMAHHPSVHTPDVAQAVHIISQLAPLGAWVHGILQALLLIAAYGLSEFILRRDLRRPLIRAGAIAYGAGVIAMLGAAMVSGFIIADLMSLTPHTTPVDLQINAQLLALCHVLNQSCANFGAVAMSAGIALWSADLLRDTGAPRMIGILGLAVSVAPAFALMSGLMHLDVPGMTAIIVLQAAWNVAVGIAMMRSRI
jgi:hypothetical protein